MTKINLEDYSFTYTVHADGSVEYIAGADKVKQNLSGRNTSSKDELEADLAEYTRAYVAGLQTSQFQAGAGLTVGEPNTAEAEAPAKPDYNPDEV